LSQERVFWLAWSQIEGIGPTLLLRLQHHFGTLESAWNASPQELEGVEGVGRQTAELVIRRRSHLDPEKLLHIHTQANPQFWTPADPLYPRLLLEMPDPPPVLYYRGEVEPLEQEGIIPAIAIVGTREPSDYGRRWTRRVSAALAQAGFTVVSGLAEGVDTEAHASCLGAGGRTIAVLGTGVDVVYPPSNRRLTEQICQQGLLMSEYPRGTQPDRPHFPRRNRLIAGLSRAVLVLEAPQKSGALITARLANDYGRDVYALPGSLDNARCIGCLELINNGAHLILGIKALLDQLGTLPQLPIRRSNPTQLSLFDSSSAPTEPSTPQPLSLAPDLQAVLHVIPEEAIAVDTIVSQSRLETGIVLSALAQLELLGLVTQVPGMRYQKAEG